MSAVVKPPSAPPPPRPTVRRRVWPGLARRVAFHLLHPELRESTLEAPAPRPLRRVRYTATDGWRAPLFHLPARPGGAGEPVLLAHPLGLGPRAFRYGPGPTLAGALSRAGFSVYLLTHRGDADALPPPDRTPCDVDAVLERDLGPALEAAAADAGFARVHWVGHGLGGQLGLALASRRPPSLASVTALCAPVAWPGPPPRSEWDRLARAATWLPDRWCLPTRAAAWSAVPWVADGSVVGAPHAPGARVRGALSYTVQDVPSGLLSQARRWIAQGAFVDRTGLLDYAESLVDAVVPLHVVHPSQDPRCPAAGALLALHRWGHPDRRARALPEGWTSLDALFAHDVGSRVVTPVVAWLEARRRRAWFSRAT